MADILKITLLGDGSSDRCLLSHVLWIVSNHLTSETIIEPVFLSSPHVRRGPGLRGRILATLQEAPCDILFVHRDAERESFEGRLVEVQNALRSIDNVTVPIIPVRMMEAWLLFDSAAIRLAADNPHGQVQLNLPRVRELEQLVDPKKRLEDLLCVASEKSGRRLEQFKRDLAGRVHRVAEVIDDFSPLRVLHAFRKFEAEALAALSQRK